MYVSIEMEIFTILKAYGIREEFVMAISIMYEDTTAKVIVPDGETETINSLYTIVYRQL